MPVPESMRRLLRDPHGTTEWTPPVPPPPPPMIRAAIAALERALEPAPPEAVRDCLKALAHGCAHKAADTLDWTYQARLYARALAELPADLWQEAVREILLSAEWFPATAALARIALPKLAERRRMLARARRMLDAPPASDGRPAETREQRLRASLATFRRLGLVARAQNVERQLAALSPQQPTEHT